MKIVERAAAESDGTAMNQTAELGVIYRYAPIGLCVYDRDLRFLRVNDSLAKFHNLSPVEHIGRRVEDVSPECGKEIANCLRRVFASGEAILNVEKHRLVPGNRLCAEDTPAIAILDVIMPKLGGVATAQKLATNFRGLPVIFASGYSQDSESVGAAATNAHYLQKPYSPMALGRQVREILDQTKRAKAAK